MSEAPLTSSWQGIPLTGTICDPTPGGPKSSGSVEVTLSALVTNKTEKKIFQPGRYINQPLDETPGAPSFRAMIPATDDPDNMPAKDKLIRVVVKTSWGTLTYDMDVPIATVGVLDLTDFVPAWSASQRPQSSGASQPVLLLGKAGGIPTLDADGLVPAEQLPPAAGVLPAGDPGDVLQSNGGAWVPKPVEVAAENVAGLTDALALKADTDASWPLTALETMPVARIVVGGVEKSPDPQTGKLDLGVLPGGTGAVAAADITDATQIGQQLVTAQSADAARTALGAVSTIDVQRAAADAVTSTFVQGTGIAITTNAQGKQVISSTGAVTAGTTYTAPAFDAAALVPVE